MLGPGPSSVPARILGALGAPTIGHLDPAYIEIMDSVCVKLREVYRTSNAPTFPVSATGMAGMETVVTNLMEPGDEVILRINGVFGMRREDVMQRAGVTVHALNVPWGEIFPDEMIANAIDSFPKTKAVAIVHAEASTGANQPLEGISRLAKAAGMLFIVDVVTSLAGHPVEVDAWGIDAIYSGTQKCLVGPPGLSPVSFSPLALEARFERHRAAHLLLHACVT